LGTGGRGRCRWGKESWGTDGEIRFKVRGSGLPRVDCRKEKGGGGGRRGGRVTAYRGGD